MTQKPLLAKCVGFMNLSRELCLPILGAACYSSEIEHSGNLAYTAPAITHAVRRAVLTMRSLLKLSDDCQNQTLADDLAYVIRKRLLRVATWICVARERLDRFKRLPHRPLWISPRIKYNIDHNNRGPLQINENAWLIIIIERLNDSWACVEKISSLFQDYTFGAQVYAITGRGTQWKLRCERISRPLGEGTATTFGAEIAALYQTPRNWLDDSIE